MRTTHGTILLAALLAGLGCENRVVDPPDTGPVVLEDGGPGTDACTACPRDSGPTGDGNDTFATATAITPGATSPTEGEINPAGDLDYYTFQGTAGQWIGIDARVEETTVRADPAITLYDSAMNQVADNDDLLPRFDNLASEIITRLPATGTYYVLVQEFSTWAGEPGVGGPNFDYDVEVFELNPAAALVNVDAEENDDAATAQALTATVEGASYILGTVEDATDVDVYSFTLPETGLQYSVNLMPDGTDGNGAAGAPARMWITNEGGTEILARMAPPAFSPVGQGENVEFSPPLTPGASYRLFIEGGATADFYVIKAFPGGDNDPEALDATNGDPTMAEVIPLTANAEVAGLRSGFVLASVGDGDTDYFSITTMGTEQISVTCGSRSLGSGVVDLTVTLFDSTGVTEIATDTETETEGATIEDEVVPSAGTYLVRLTKASQSPDVTSTFARCGFHVQPPAP